MTALVAAVLAASYAYQLLLPLSGTTTVSVDLTAPANVGTELFVLGLALLWLYVGYSNLRFSSKITKEIGQARTKESEVRARVT